MKKYIKNASFKNPKFRGKLDEKTIDDKLVGEGISKEAIDREFYNRKDDRLSFGDTKKRLEDKLHMNPDEAWDYTYRTFDDDGRDWRNVKESRKPVKCAEDDFDIEDEFDIEEEPEPIVFIDGRRDGYAPDQIIDYTMTVGELIDELSQYDSDTKVMLINDNGYTFGYIDDESIRLGDITQSWDRHR